jgi:fermentation-respiration switch protein FrsA (DUF1100 family)
MVRTSLLAGVRRRDGGCEQRGRCGIGLQIAYRKCPNLNGTLGPPPSGGVKGRSMPPSGAAADFVGRLKLPLLMLAGEADMQRGCCLIGTARALAAAAAGRPFELVTYPNAQHGFIYGGGHYNAQAYADAMQRTAAKLAQYLGR